MLPKAIFSEDRKYRYILTRTWDESKGYVCFIGLNPSTADEETDDPTIRRCIGYAKYWGYGGILMCNLFAYRATDPKEMLNEEDPVGPFNTQYLKSAVYGADISIACWGVHGKHLERGKHVKKIIKENLNDNVKIFHLGLTKDGHPKHPLYLKKDLKPTEWL